VNMFEKLSAVQSTVKATKDAYNSFGKYNYRSCESILEAVKPVLQEYKCSIVLKDDVVQIGERFYIKATAEFIDCESDDKSLSVSSFAREEETKKGMDGAQITGSSSSYARKYALAGLLLLDDNKDPDAMNKHGKDKDNNKKPAEEPFPDVNDNVSEDKVKQLEAIYTVFQKEHRETFLKLMNTKYKIKNLSELNTQQFVKYREELLTKAEDAKKSRLENMVSVFAQKSGKSVDEAKQVIELCIGKNLSDVMIAEFHKVVKEVTQMIDDLEVA